MSAKKKDNDVNPKDRLGIKKVPLALLPLSGQVVQAMAHHIGKEKYGTYNWRERAVQMTIYLEAAKRHIELMLTGEDMDPDSYVDIPNPDGSATRVHVPHSGCVMACMAIIEDARAAGCLIDDRSILGEGGAALLRMYTAADYKKTEEQIRKSKSPCKTLGEVSGRRYSPTLQEIQDAMQRPASGKRGRA